MEIKSTNNIKGLFSSEVHKINTKIHKLQGEIQSKPTRTTIEVGVNQHIDDNHGIYMNHSFDPSCKIEDGYIVAIKDIDCGEELTFNYNDSETKMSCPFKDNETHEMVSGKKTA